MEWTIVLCLALADFPLNMTSFTLAPIGQRALHAVAVGIGVLVALAVVVIGRAAKVVVDEDLPRKKTVAYLFGIVIGFIALFIGVQGLALLRERFVEQAPAIKSLGVNLTGIGSAFVKIQLCLILLGVLAAFWAHNVAASRRRRETFKVLWHSVRIWLLTNRRDWFEVKLARVGARLSVLTERFAAKVEGLRGLLQYAVELYRTVLLQRHPEAADPDIGDRPSVILPGRGLRPVPNRWAMPGSRRLTRWLFGDELPRSVRAPTPVPSPNGSGGHRAKPEELAE